MQGRCETMWYGRNAKAQKDALKFLSQWPSSPSHLPGLCCVMGGMLSVGSVGSFLPVASQGLHPPAVGSVAVSLGVVAAVTLCSCRCVLRPPTEMAV